jgi:hypothetical protein
LTRKAKRETDSPERRPERLPAVNLSLISKCIQPRDVREYKTEVKKWKDGRKLKIIQSAMGDYKAVLKLTGRKKRRYQCEKQEVVEDDERRGEESSWRKPFCTSEN